MNQTLSDERRPGWLWVDNSIVDDYAPQIGAYGLALYTVLARYADRNGASFPSYQTLARILGLSRNTIIKTVKLLVDAGLLRVTPRAGQSGQESNLYTLQQPGVVQQMHPPSAGDAPGVVQQMHPPSAPRAPEQDLINKTQFNNSESDADASPPLTLPPASAANKARRADRDPHLDHPAVIKYRDLAHRTPTPVARASIATAVTDITRWEQAVRQWLLCGYRPDNIAGILDWYRTGAYAQPRGISHAKNQSTPAHGSESIDYDNEAALARLLARGNNGHG